MEYTSAVTGTTQYGSPCVMSADNGVQKTRGLKKVARDLYATGTLAGANAKGVVMPEVLVPATSPLVAVFPATAVFPAVVSLSTLDGVFDEFQVGLAQSFGNRRITLSIQENSSLLNELGAPDGDSHGYRDYAYLGKKSNHYIQSRDRSYLAAILT